MTGKKGETEAQIIRKRLIGAYQSFGLLTPHVIKDRKVVNEIKTKFLAVATPLILAANGEYEENGEEYKAILVLANALIDRIVTVTEKATEKISILIT